MLDGIKQWPGATPPKASNPIHALLDHAGVPWRITRAEIVRHYGIHRDPAYQSDVIPIPTTPPLVEGLVYPLSARAFPGFTPLLPITRFSGVTWFGHDVPANLERTASQLRPALGPATLARQNNTLCAEWRSGAAIVRLMGWPPELNTTPLQNPSHQRDPRLATGCHLTIETGFRPPRPPKTSPGSTRSSPSPPSAASASWTVPP